MPVARLQELAVCADVRRKGALIVPAIALSIDLPNAAVAAADGLIAAGVHRRIAAGDFRVPPMPRVAAEVLALAQDQRSDAARFAALIHGDQALAAGVLRLANSAALTARSPIVSLRQAVARLGMAEIAGIALAASLQGGVFQLAGHEERLLRLWRHALAAGAFAREVARQRRAGVESAYLCGLLHTIGMPVVVRLAQQEATAAGVALSPGLIDQLSAAHYVAVGARVALEWKLPSVVAAAISHHRDPERAGPHAADCATTWLAGRLASSLLTPAGADATPLGQDPAVALLNLYSDDVAALVAAGPAVLALVEAAAP